MLIICPECGEKVSDKSDICVHCGYPIKKMYIQENKNICVIDGIPYDLSEQLANINNEQYQPLKKLVKEYGMSLADASNLWRLIKTSKQIPQEYNSSQQEEYRKQLNTNEISNIPQCPYCHSTNLKKISTSGRIVSVGVFGLGSSKIGKQWHCNNCKSDF